MGAYSEHNFHAQRHEANKNVNALLYVCSDFVNYIIYLEWTAMPDDNDRKTDYDKWQPMCLVASERNGTQKIARKSMQMDESR